MPTIKLPRRGIAYPFPSPSAKDMDNARTRMRRLFEEPFTSLFGDPFSGDFFVQPLGWNPALDVAETASEFTVTAELPGMSRKDVQVDFEDGVLMIRGEKEEKKEEKDDGKRYHLYERSYGTFQRALTFPFADPDQINAEFADGVLTVHLPKLPEGKTRGRKIAIGERK